MEIRLSDYAPRIELETRSQGDPIPRIVGYAAVFFNPAEEATRFRLGRFEERMMPGAFDESLRRDDVLGLWEHNKATPLGRTSSGTLKLSVDNRGLKYSIQADTRLGLEVRQLIERGDVKGSSIGFFDTVDKVREEKGVLIREIVKTRIRDVGPVLQPSYPGTSAEIRSGDDVMVSVMLARLRADRERYQGVR